MRADVTKHPRKKLGGPGLTDVRTGNEVVPEFVESRILLTAQHKNCRTEIIISRESAQQL